MILPHVTKLSDLFESWGPYHKNALQFFSAPVKYSTYARFFDHAEPSLTVIPRPEVLSEISSHLVVAGDVHWVLGPRENGKLQVHIEYDNILASRLVASVDEVAFRDPAPEPVAPPKEEEPAVILPVVEETQEEKERLVRSMTEAERAGVTAIVHLQKLVGIKEPYAVALKNWRIMPERHKEQTMQAYRKLYHARAD